MHPLVLNTLARKCLLSDQVSEVGGDRLDALYSATDTCILHMCKLVGVVNCVSRVQRSERVVHNHHSLC